MSAPLQGRGRPPGRFPWPSGISEGEDAGDRPLQRARVELLKIALVEEGQGSQIPLCSPLPRGPSSLRTPPSPTAAFGPCTSVVGSSAQGKLQSGRTGRAARGQHAPSRKEPASPQSCLLSTPFVISVLVELVFGVLCFKVFCFCLFHFCFEGVGGIQSS